MRETRNDLLLLALVFFFIAFGFLAKGCEAGGDDYKIVVDTGEYVVEILGDYFFVDSQGYLCVYREGEDDLLVGVFNHWESAYIVP